MHAMTPEAEWSEVGDNTIFRDIGDGRAYLDRDLNVWRVFLPPSCAVRCIQAIEAEFWLADWAGGLLWIGAPPDDDAFAQKIRTALATAGGSAILVRASPEMRRRTDVFPAQPPVLAELTRSVKAAFDPLGIFNPGRMYQDI